MRPERFSIQFNVFHLWKHRGVWSECHFEFFSKFNVEKILWIDCSSRRCQTKVLSIDPDISCCKSVDEWFIFTRWQRAEQGNNSWCILRVRKEEMSFQLRHDENVLLLFVPYSSWVWMSLIINTGLDSSTCSNTCSSKICQSFRKTK